ILAQVAANRFVPHFQPRNQSAPALPNPERFTGRTTMVENGWVLSADRLSDPKWWVIVRVPEPELTALINHNIRSVIAVGILLTLMAVPIAIWLISPLLKRLAEEALKELNSNLERAIEEEIARRREHEHILVHQARLAQMGEMIGAIAHQWRQPLNALALAVQDLTDAKQFGELDDAYLADMTAKSMRLINQMSKTIDDFRGFFKSDRQKVPFDPAQTVSESIELLHSQLERHNITIKWQPPERPICFEGYPNELKQVVLNLLANARDAIDEHGKTRAVKGEVSLWLRESDRQITLQVQDNGGGIPHEIAERIFDPYFSTKEEGKGVGLGLYMSKLIIEEHMGGRLRHENCSDGACFTVSLPLVSKP
ncbi:MAG: sensor histidine kinase, partial [Campylobacterales bacterium]